LIAAGSVLTPALLKSVSGDTHAGDKLVYKKSPSLTGRTFKKLLFVFQQQEFLSIKGLENLLHLGQ